MGRAVRFNFLAFLFSNFFSWLAGKCPVEHNAPNSEEKPKENVTLENDESDEEEDSEDEELNKIGTKPSVKQYKKLKKVMSSITSFYANGSM